MYESGQLCRVYVNDAKSLNPFGPHLDCPIQLGFVYFPKGPSSSNHSIYLGPKGFPHNYFRALVYYISTWTLWVVRFGKHTGIEPHHTAQTGM